MNCAQANGLNLAGWLSMQGYEPQKIMGNNYWYLSPLREEKEASFKVNNSLNICYDHGLGKGGRLVDLVIEIYHCNTSEALQKIVSFHPQKRDEKHAAEVQNNNEINTLNTEKNSLVIISATAPVTDKNLCNYALKRKIYPEVLNKWCREVCYQVNEQPYKAIGFKNNAGGYELRSEQFKGSSSPKIISYINNQAKELAVFEGFFDLLAHESSRINQPQLTNYLVLNSLAFFERSLLLMEKHDRIKLYLDNDEGGKKCTLQAVKRSSRFSDESNMYKGYKDLSEWWAGVGRQQKQGLGVHRH